MLQILGAVLIWIGAIGAGLQRGQGYQISPKPCWVDGMEGTCMFVYECIKSEGFHIGMCVDSFMFGSCCAHNATDNSVLPVSNKPSVLYTPPSQANKRPTTSRPKHTSRPQLNKPSTSHSKPTTAVTPRPPHHTVSTSYHVRPNARPSTSPPRQSIRPMSTDTLHSANSISIGHYTKPGFQQSTKPTWSTKPGYTTKAGWQTTTEPGFVSGHNSIHSHGTKPGSQWQFTTEPGFVTKVKTRPGSSSSYKPSSYKPTSFKPKPTKKPIPVTTNKNTIKYSTKTTTTSTTSTTTTTTTTTTSTTTPRPTIKGPPSTISPEIQKITLAPDLQPTSTISSVSAASADNVGCGQPQLFPQAQTRIVGGKNAPFGRWPWQVSVRRTSFFGFSSTHRCGGAVLNDNWIATAGHCVDDLLTSQIRIRVGEYDFSSVQEELPYVERAVARKVVHPKYNFFTYEYDLALVQLDKPLEFAPHISPICLPASDDLLIGENATVTGWGRLSEGGTLPSVLQEPFPPMATMHENRGLQSPATPMAQSYATANGYAYYPGTFSHRRHGYAIPCEVQVPIVSNDRCKSMFLRAGRHEFIPEIFLCAGHENGGQDSCQGDSGGPLQVRGKDGRYFLAGIISWGIGCAEANLPGVCTRISKFVPWILNNVT